MICNRSIEGVNKNITMNRICDRIDIGYSVYDLDPETGEFEVWHTRNILRCLSERSSVTVSLQAVVAYPAEPFSTENKQLQWLNESRLIYFIDKNATFIPDSPRCGFNNIKCPENSSCLFRTPMNGKERSLCLRYSSSDTNLGLDHHQSFFDHCSSSHRRFRSLSVRERDDARVRRNERLCFRRAKFEAELKAMQWLIKWEELSTRTLLHNTVATPSFNKLSLSQRVSPFSSLDQRKTRKRDKNCLARTYPNRYR